VTEAGYRVVTLVARLARRDVTPPVPVRHPTDDDRAELPHVMLDAYRGGFDEPEMTLDDARGYVRRFFEEGAATPLIECSFVALGEGRIVAAALVCLDEGRPLLAQAYTVPSWTNRGLARALIQSSMNALMDRGDSALTLVVTIGNLPAEHLYASMGFSFESGRA
jgi:GNAT superfamily N-acetyltransferase